MIAFLKGKVIKKNIDSAIIDVNGVGYLVYMPLSTLTHLNLNDDVQLYITTVSRENVIELYGFLTEKEQEVFKKLMKVPKIGAKLSCIILSGIDVEKLISAIKENNTKLLSSIPGIGKKTAERICIDLKDKFEIREKYSSSMKEELISALINLGFKRNEIENIAEKITKKHKDEPIENLLKLAFKEIYKWKKTFWKKIKNLKKP